MKPSNCIEYFPFLSIMIRRTSFFSATLKCLLPLLLRILNANSYIRIIPATGSLIHKTGSLLRGENFWLFINVQTGANVTCLHKNHVNWTLLKPQACLLIETLKLSPCYVDTLIIFKIIAPETLADAKKDDRIIECCDSLVKHRVSSDFLANFYITINYSHFKSVLGTNSFFSFSLSFFLSFFLSIYLSFLISSSVWPVLLNRCRCRELMLYLFILTHTHTHTHTHSLGRIPLGEWSAWHRDLYLIKHSTH
jgi:hypothetical protein